jgi:hypothetical protein
VSSAQRQDIGAEKGSRTQPFQTTKLLFMLDTIVPSFNTVSAPLPSGLRPPSFSHVSDLARLVPSYFICRAERIEVISQELLG